MKTYIIGHKKPDTDAVVAALAYAYLAKKLDCLGYKEPTAVIVDPLNPETSYLFDKLKLAHPRLISADEIEPSDQIVLVDHNEANQRLDNLNPDQIKEIIDHHKINLNLSKPIFLNFKPWGSSVTIIYFMMSLFQVKPDKTLATLMLAAILSDTVGFKSATTTDKDKELAQELAEIAQIDDLTGFALEIFKAKSNVSQLSDYQLATNDYKLFDFGKQKVFINQVETVEQKKLLEERKAGLLTALAKVKSEMAADFAFIAVSDVLNVNTKLLVPNGPEIKIAQEAFGGEVIDHILDIGGKLSRKKEIAPALEKVIQLIG